MSTKQGKPVDIEALLAEAAAATPTALKAAIAAHAETESKKQQVRLQAQFAMASQLRDYAVEELRESRRVEAKAKTKLTAVAEGHAEFLKTGDASAIAKAVAGDDGYALARLNDQFSAAALRAENELLNPNGRSSRY